jgi:bifunctional isochorismate lyase/aryl carrier protein
MNKEQYFSPENIQAISRKMLVTLMPFRERHRDQIFDIHKAALLVLDMQRFFLDPVSHAYIPSGPAILPGILRLERIFEEKQRPVILTRHLNSISDAGRMGTWWHDLILAESPLSQLVDEVEVTHRSLICKSQYDAFFGTNLESLLKTAHIEQILICGVMTHLCCETTARSAFMRGFEVFVAIDGMATYNRAFHEAAILNLSHGFAYPLLVEEIETLTAR